MHALADLLFVGTGDRRDVEARVAAARCTLLVALAGFCLSVACAFTMPILFGVDERVHLGYVEVVLQGDLPEVDSDVPLDGHFRALREFYPSGTEAAGPRGDVWVANHPPLMYLMAAPPAWLAATLGIDIGPPMVLRLLSGLGMSIGVVATAAVSDALLPRRHRSAVLAAALASTTPGLVSIGAFGYNDGAAFAIGTALLAVVLRLARVGPSRGALVATLGLGAAAVLVRSSLLPLVPIAAVVWLVRTWRSSPRRAVLRAAAVALVPAIAGGWFYLRNIDLYGSFSGSGHLQEKFGRTRVGSTGEVMRRPLFLAGAWQDLWGSLKSNAAVGSGRILVGTTDADLGSRLAIGGGLAIASVAGWLRSLVRPRGRASAAGRFTWAVALGWLGTCVVALASFVGGGGSPHPRYLLPSHSVAVVVLVGGLTALPWSRRLVPGVLVSLVAIDLMLFARLGIASREQPFPEQFSQPGASAVVVIAALALGLVAASAAVSGLRGIEDEPTEQGPIVRG